MSHNQERLQQLLRWIKLESEAEAAQLDERRRQGTKKDAERSGETLLDLAVTGHELGVGGQTLLTLAKRNRTLRLPWTRLRVGSRIMLSTDEPSAKAERGVVTALSRESIEVAVADWPEGERFRLDLSADEVTRKRQAKAVKTVQDASGRTKQLRDTLLGEREPRFLESIDVELPDTLNSTQHEAISFALAAEDLAIIHGPPGTGKTTTVVELIRQAVNRGQNVLACAPSNTAVDNLLERLIASGNRVVRLGHPARVDEQLRPYTLDAQVAEHELMDVAKDMLREADSLFRKAGRYTRAKPAPGAKPEMRREARRLKADARTLERQVVQTVLDSVDVVCATLAFDESLLGDRRFDLVVIDEACQSTEPGCWIPVLKADRIVLAGDHCQLPPTVLSTTAAREGLTTSLMERLIHHFGESISRQLKVQYRMHAQIMGFSSQQFYQDTLEADESVSTHTLCDLPNMESSPLTDSPMAFIDTAGADWHEEEEPNGASKRNPSEAAFVLRKIEQLVAAGLEPKDIAIITPYAAQVRWLREQSNRTELEIDTVDGFQGREKEAVLISCVRSNPKGEIGFLADTRRMNVALTRARRKLIIVGDSATLGGHEFYAAMLAYFESILAYHSIWEEQEF